MNLNFLQPILLIKIVTLIAIVFYAIFGFVVFTQVKAMGEIIGLPHALKVFRNISIINIGLAISLFLLALVIL